MPADTGFHTSVKTPANRGLYEPALEKGRFGVVLEYAATLAEFLNTKVNGAGAEPVASGDVTTRVAALTGLAAERGPKVLPAGKAAGRNAFAITSARTSPSSTSSRAFPILVRPSSRSNWWAATNRRYEGRGRPAVATVLHRPTAVLATAGLTALNRKVDAERQKPADVAAGHRNSKARERSGGATAAAFTMPQKGHNVPW